jgi:hypothetical protein
MDIAYVTCEVKGCGCPSFAKEDDDHPHICACGHIKAKHTAVVWDKARAKKIHDKDDRISAWNSRPDKAPVKHDFLELELSSPTHTNNTVAVAVGVAAPASALPEADVEYETMPPRPLTRCEKIFNCIWYFFIRTPNESYLDCVYYRIVYTVMCAIFTVPIWVPVLVSLLPKRNDDDGDWCGCILGPSAQTYNSNAETDAADCQPMLNGSIVLDPNCYWRDGATFCQAAQAWPYPITRPCQELSGF